MGGRPERGDSLKVTQGTMAELELKHGSRSLILSSPLNQIIILNREDLGDHLVRLPYTLRGTEAQRSSMVR